MANQFINFYYDPQRQGYDTTLWKTIAGTPSISSNKLRLNAATIIHYGDILRGEFVFNVTIPAVPTSGDSRQIGLAQLNKGSYAYFDVTGAVFSAKVSTGTSSTSTAITWQAAWTNVATKYTIRWEGGLIKFFVGGALQATMSNTGTTTYLTGDPMSLYVSNSNSDNMDITDINAKQIQSYV